MPRKSGAKTTAGKAPVAEMRIADLETIRVMSDPLRLRILQGMAAEIEEPWTVKRLASTLGVPATKLYYHVNLLEKHGLVRVTDTAIVSGIVESRYAVAARRFEVDRSVFAAAAPGTGDAMVGLITTILDTTRSEILAGLASGAISTADEGPDSPHRLTITKGGVRLSRTRAEELRRRLEAVLAEFESDDDPDGIALAGLVAIYPIETGAR